MFSAETIREYGVPQVNTTPTEKTDKKSDQQIIKIAKKINYFILPAMYGQVQAIIR